MLLLITDIHCQFEIVNVQVAHAELTTGRKVDCVIVLGDFGLYDAPLHRYFIRENERFVVPVFFIEGNHEDFTRFSGLTTEFAHCFTHLPRGTRHLIGGVKLLALGGAKYMDSVNTPLNSEVRPEDIQKCLKIPSDEIEVVVSHDCPHGVPVPHTLGMEDYGSIGFAGGEELMRHFSPRIWVFGHHHKWFEKRIGETDFFGLAESWNGYAILEKNFQITVVRNVVELRKTFWQKIQSFFY